MVNQMSLHPILLLCATTLIFVIYPIYTLVQNWRNKSWETSEKVAWTIAIVLFIPFGSVVFSFFHEKKKINKIAPLIGISLIGIMTVFLLSNTYQKYKTLTTHDTEQAAENN